MLDANFTPEEKELGAMALLTVAMRRLLPAGNSLVEMITNLSSPVTAQHYRAETLYEGPMRDKSSIDIRDCDPLTPLVLYVSKLVPRSDEGCRYSFGRVFSSIVRAGPKIRIQGPKYVPRGDLIVRFVQRTVLRIGCCV